jgi:hypothetical protein
MRNIWHDGTFYGGSNLMIRMILLLILVAVIAVPTPASAAVRKRRARGPAGTTNVGKGKIVGHVVDAKGHPLSRARLHIHRLRRAGVHPRLRAGGMFGTRALAPGTYVVNAANRGAGRGKSVAMVVAGRATSVTVRVHKRRGHHAHQKHALGTLGKSITKHSKPAPASTAKQPAATPRQPASTPRPAVVPNKAK